MNNDHKPVEEKLCPWWKKPCSEVADCSFMITVMGRHPTLGTPVQLGVCKMDVILQVLQQVAAGMQTMPRPGPLYPRNPSTGG